MIFSLKNSILTFEDGTTPTAQFVEVNMGDGNISWDETRELEYLKDRGNLDSVEETEENPISVDMSFRWTEFKSTGGVVTPYEAITVTGQAVTDGWITTDTKDACAPISIDIVVDFTPNCAAEQKEIYRLRAFRYESISPSGSDRQITCSGSCNYRHVEVTRTPQV